MKFDKKKSHILTTIAIATILLSIFYGNILINPGKYMFATSGDGLKNYYGSYYHLKYDSDYLFTRSQNYPYGESVFFCDSQPFLTNNLLFLQKFGFDFSNNIIGLTNLLMILSIALGAIFIYLLLVNLKLPPLYSALVANIIAFLSPQLDRMGGHFSLSYVFFIPLFLYIFHKFYNNPKYLTSLMLGILSFIGIATHAYFFAFFGFLTFFMMIFIGIQNTKKFPFAKKMLPHFIIQIVLPFILFQLFTIGIANDRTEYPWGFFATRSFPEAVFLPIGKPYGKFLHFNYLKWEGMAYVGLVATILFFIILFKYFKKFSRRRWYVLIKDPFLNAALWASIIALLFSFAYPFQWHLQWLWNYMGPLKQFRASGRFNWPFFYIINITTYYFLWNKFKNQKKVIPLIVISFAILWGAYDAFLNVRKREAGLMKEIVEIYDTQNKLPQNKWINSIDTSKFQAILPLPYFHIGSEVYWVDGGHEIKKSAFIVSWKTGLPIHGALLSRTSISQTLKSLAFYFDPLGEYEIIDEYPNQKDLLLIVQNGESLNENEKRIIPYASIIVKNEYYSAFSLRIDSLIKLNSDYRATIISEINDTGLVNLNGFSVNDSCFIYESYGNKSPNNKRHNTHIVYNANKPNLIIDTSLFKNDFPIKVSFWMKDLDKDLIARSMIKLSSKGSDNNFHQKIKTTLFRFVKYVDSDGWGLVEFDYDPQDVNETIRVELWNDLITKKELVLDDVFIKSINTNVYYESDKYIFKNNRYLKK